MGIKNHPAIYIVIHLCDSIWSFCVKANLCKFVFYRLAWYVLLLEIRSFCVQWVQFWLEMMVRFVDIGGIVDHYSLNCLSLFRPGFVNYKKRCTRLATASDKAYQLIAHDRWFSPGTPASSTTKTDHHDIRCSWNIAENGVKHQKIKQSIKSLFLLDTKMYVLCWRFYVSFVFWIVIVFILSSNL